MGRYLKSSEVINIKGSIAGVTFSNNASGGIIRLKSKNTNRKTLKQSNSRNRFAQANGGWHTLTDDQKILWKRAGSARKNSGLNEFVRVNKILNEASAKTVEITAADIRPNDMSQSGRKIQLINQIKEPPATDMVVDFNAGQQFANQVIRATQGTGTNYYTFRINFINTNESIVDSFLTYIDESPLSNSAGELQTLVIYGRNSKAQDSEFRYEDEFNMLLSFPFWFANSQLSQNLNFVIFRAQGSRVRALFDVYLKRNTNVELSFRVLSAGGKLTEISRNRYFYS